jgi:hypothetical protein
LPLRYEDISAFHNIPISSSLSVLIKEISFGSIDSRGSVIIKEEEQIKGLKRSGL